MGRRWRSIVEYVQKNGKRAAVAVVGFAVLAAGLVLMITPGPGLLVVIAGLAILASEFAWARGLLKRARAQARRARDRMRRRTTGR